MATVYLDTNLKEIERLKLELGSTKKQVEVAAKRAIRKLARWIQSTSLREASRDTGIKRKVLKGRLLMFVRGTQYTARVWYGLNSIPLSSLDPRQTKTGVKAGPVDRRHAFIHRGQVYRRVHKTERMPIAVQYENIADAFRRILTVDINPRFEKKFNQFFAHELRWEKRKSK